MMHTFYLQTVGVSKQKPLRLQNCVEKWLIQKHCNVLGNLLLTRQWDYTHLCIACCTQTKHKKALVLNKKIKEVEKPTSAKVEQRVSIPWKKEACKWDLGKDTQGGRTEGPQINCEYTITFWQTLAPQSRLKLRSGQEGATQDMAKVLKDFAGQWGRRTALWLCVWTAGTNTSTGQEKARLGMVSLEKSLYLPAEWAQT